MKKTKTNERESIVVAGIVIATLTLVIVMTTMNRPIATVNEKTANGARKRSAVVVIMRGVIRLLGTSTRMSINSQRESRSL